MSIKTVTSWQVLMQLAKELGNARRSKDEDRIQQAQQAHDAYKELCLNSDEMVLGYTFGELYDNRRRPTSI